MHIDWINIYLEYWKSEKPRTKPLGFLDSTFSVHWLYFNLQEIAV